MLGTGEQKMKDRDRLTELILKSEILCTTCGEVSNTYCAEYLADYLLANGVIVPPLSLNQIVWKVTNTNIDKCRVSGITQKADGSFKIRLTHSRYRSVFEIAPDRLGKDVFLTKEEAEEKLKELGK